MQAIKNCIGADSRGFIHPPLTFQVHVWCHFESYASPIRVDIHHDAQVFDVVKAAIEAEEVSTTAGRVVVKFSGNKVKPGDAINQYQTSCGTPLLLELSEPEGKLHAVTYLMLPRKLCSLCSFMVVLVGSGPCNLHTQ